MICGYTRVSSLDQNTERQLHGEMMDKLFTDRPAGRTYTGRSFWQHWRTCGRDTRFWYIARIG